MGHEKEKGLMEISQRGIRLTVFHRDQGWKRVVSMFIITSIRALFIYLSFMLIPMGDGSVTSMATAVKSLSTWAQGLTKLMTILIYERQLVELEESLEQFWEAETDVNAGIYKYGKMLMNFYICACGISLLGFHSVPYFTRKVFFNCWVPPDVPYAFEILWMLQVIALTSDVFSVVGMDLFFIAACLNLLAQFKLLHLKMESLKGCEDEISLENMYSCIKHHTFLLRYSETLISCFSMCLLCQYMITTFTACMVIYAITEDDDKTDAFVSLCYISALILQLGCYCFPADEVTETALRTSQAIYGSEWYDLPLNLQKNIGYVIQRSQISINFTAGGFIIMNKEAFTTIFKGVFSFYAAMKQVRENKEELK